MHSCTFQIGYRTNDPKSIARLYVCEVAEVRALIDCLAAYRLSVQLRFALECL